ncbi:MAG: ABC transporter ATP-binding protein, partial [Deltaproteobacteria bacterium]|nr:ABC transporter ATP-binding protein [Deltaproteobacteria bacterium]
TEGLAPMIVEMLVEQISNLRDKGLTVLLAEQNVKVALRLSSRGYIIDKGFIRFHGTIEDMKQNEDVMKKYLLV